MILPFSDIHTHRPDAGPDAVICLDPCDGVGMADMLSCHHYSAGIHPWNAARATEADWHTLEEMAADPRTVAIGEAGLDALRGPSADIQLPVFQRQALLVETVGKPLIIHAVRTFPQLIALKHSLHPSQPWIIHGFRGKPELARELLRHGFHISLGPRHNAATAEVIPPDRLHHESDAM